MTVMFIDFLTLGLFDRESAYVILGLNYNLHHSVPSDFFKWL